MLSIIEYGKDEYEFPALLVLGCFDAIHAGHRELLKKAKLQAKINGLDLGVMMFKEGKGGKLVYSFEERAKLLEQYNVKFIMAVDFNDEFKATAPLDFLHTVEDKINVKAYMSGKDFRFGAQAKGKSSTLKNYAEDEENGVWYMPVKDIDLNGEKISTTLIKKCLENGEIAKANELLGTEFSLEGEVVKGEGRGTSVVGFPTVNIFYPEWKHPIKHGVYSVKSEIDGTEYQGIANFGNCPTFGDERVCFEAYFEGFSGDLYGRILTVKFTGYIRDIEEFGSAEELSEQLQSDLTAITDSEQPVEVVAEAVVEDITEEQPVEEEVIEEQPVEEEVAEEVVEEQPVGEEIIKEDVEEQHVEEEVVEEVVEEQPAEEEVAEEVVDEQFVEEYVEEQLADDITEEEGFDEIADDLDGFDEPIEQDYSEAEETAAEQVEPEIIEEPAEDIQEEIVEEQPSEEISEEVAEEQLTDEEVEAETTDEQSEEVVEEIVEEQPVQEISDEEVEEEQSVEEGAEEQYAEYIGKDGEENLD